MSELRERLRPKGEFNNIHTIPKKGDVKFIYHQYEKRKTISSTFQTLRYRYFVTLKKSNCKAFTTIGEIYGAIEALKKAHEFDNSNFHILTLGVEMDQYKQLHGHMVIFSNKIVRFKTNCKYNGLRLFWKPINSVADAERCFDYCHKVDLCLIGKIEMILIYNYYLNKKDSAFT